MSQPIDKYRKKDFMTGYTGHVPKKLLLFGLTTGDTCRLLKDNQGTDLFYKGKHLKHVERRQSNSV